MGVVEKILGAGLMLGLAILVQAAPADQLANLAWVDGPTNGDLGPAASINVPAEFQFLPSHAAKDLQQRLQLSTDSSEKATYAFRPKNATWVAVLEYDASGKVKDEERIDPKSLFESLRTVTDQKNPSRVKMRWPSIELVRWFDEPSYDQTTHSLRWSALYREVETNREFVTLSTILLGKSGYVQVTIPNIDPKEVRSIVQQLQFSLLGFQFSQGERYLDRTSTLKTYGVPFFVIVAIGIGVYFFRRMPLKAADAGQSEKRSQDSGAYGADNPLRPWWEVLNISPNATAEEISAAYKREIRQYHPDKVATMGPAIKEVAESKSKEINDAYRTAQNGPR